MPDLPNLIRLFVSSTFRDMHAERDYLNRFVFPELRSRCSRHGVEFVGVDLRWGVTAEEAEQRGALKICLEEIDRCRPYFLGLLGERYGWVPPVEEIPQEFFDDSRQDASLTSEEASLLDEWYRLDRFSSPPVYTLRRDRPIPAALADWQADFWEQRGLANAGESVTAQEIMHALRATELPARALFYLRQPGLPAQPHFPPQWTPVFAETSPKNRLKLEALRRMILQRAGRPGKPASAGSLIACQYAVRYAGLRLDPSHLPPGLTEAERELFQDGEIQPDEYAGLSPSFRLALDRHGTVALEGLDAWGAQVLDDLWAAIESRLAAGQGLPGGPAGAGGAAGAGNPAGAGSENERFLAERAGLFFGREDLIARVLDYTQASQDRSPLTLTGEPGSGKSALLAVCARRCRENSPGALAIPLVIPHFIGIAPGSNLLDATLLQICELLRREGGLASEIPADPQRLRMEWVRFLEEAAAVRPVVLFLDGLNQLDPAGGSHQLDWLPFRLPPGVRLVVSTLPGVILERLQKTLPGENLLEVLHLPRSDRAALIDAFLARRGKKLARQQVDLLLDTQARPDAGLPLYIRVAVEELALYGDYDTLNPRIVSLPPKLPELFDQVLARLETDHTLYLTRSILTWLAGSRSGLLESELLDLLEGAFPGFPHIRWTQLYRALESHLRRIDPTSGLGLLGFYHDQWRHAVHRRYLDMPDPTAPPSAALVKVHRRLADYFASPDGSGQQPAAWYSARPRALAELPYHLAHGGFQEELQRILTDFSFLQAKVQALGPQPLIEDYDLALAPTSPPARAGVETGGEVLGLIQSALRLSAHVLVQDPAQLAGQLIGRLLVYEAPEIRALRQAAAGWRTVPWLRPVTPALLQAGHPNLRTLDAHAYPIRAVALTPDGRRAVSASDDASLKLWDIASGAELRRYAGHTGPVLAAITLDGRRLASGSQDKTIRVWDLESGDLLGCLAGHGEAVSSLAVTRDGRRLVSGSYDATIRIWDLEKLVEVRSLAGHAYGVNAVALCPQDRRIISASYDHTLRVWDLDSGALLLVLSEHQGPVNGVAVDPGGRWIVSTSADHSLKIWDLRTGNELQTLAGHTDEVTGVAVTRQGLVVSASWDRTLRVWDLGNPEASYALTGHPYRVTGVAVTPDGSQAVSAGWDTTLRVWDLAARSAPEQAPGHNGYVDAVFIERGEFTAISFSEDTQLIWELKSGALKSRNHGKGRISRYSNYPSRKLDERRELRLSRYGDNGYLDLVIADRASGEVLQTLTGHSRPIIALAYCPARSLALSVSHDRTVIAWDTNSGARLSIMKGHTREIWDVAITLDGRRAVTASDDSTLILWNLDRFEREAQFTAEGALVACAIAPHGHTAVAADESGRVHILRPVWVDNRQSSPALIPAFRRSNSTGKGARR